MQGVQARPKNFDLSQSKQNSWKSGKWRLTFLNLKNGVQQHMKTLFWRSYKKMSSWEKIENLQAKVEKSFRASLGKSGKNPLHSQKFACFYNSGRRLLLSATMSCEIFAAFWRWAWPWWHTTSTDRVQTAHMLMAWRMSLGAKDFVRP